MYLYLLINDSLSAKMLTNQFFLLTFIQQKVALTVTLHKFTRKMVTMDIQQTLCHSKALLTSPLPTLVLTE